MANNKKRTQMSYRSKARKRSDPNEARATAAQKKYLKSLSIRFSDELGREPEKLLQIYTIAEASLLIDRLLQKHGLSTEKKLFEKVLRKSANC